MNRICKCILLLLSFFGYGCDSGGSDTQIAPFVAADLDGVWISNCYYHERAGSYMIDEFSFSEGTTQFIGRYYDEEGCTGNFINTIRGYGEITVGKGVTTGLGYIGAEVDYHIYNEGRVSTIEDILSLDSDRMYYGKYIDVGVRPNEMDAAVTMVKVSENEKILYVGENGECEGRRPCFSNLQDAALDSLQSQFEKNKSISFGLVAKKIVVLSGVHYSKKEGDWVLNLNKRPYNRAEEKWLLTIESELGANETIISGENSGPCIQIGNRLDFHLKGFTISDCFQLEVSSEDYVTIRVRSNRDAEINIEQNRFINNFYASAAVGIRPDNGDIIDLNVKVQRNTFINNLGGVKIDFPSSVEPNYIANVLVVNNVIHENENGIGVDNFSSAEQSVAINIVHNTVFDNSVVGVNVNQANGIVVTNNIVANNAIDIMGESSSSDGVNIILSNVVTEESSLNAEGNFVSDPLILLDGQLTEESIAIDAASSLDGVDVRLDYLGRTRGESADIGAFEFGVN